MKKESYIRHQSQESQIRVTPLGRFLGGAALTSLIATGVFFAANQSDKAPVQPDQTVTGCGESTIGTSSTGWNDGASKRALEDAYMDATGVETYTVPYGSLREVSDSMAEDNIITQEGQIMKTCIEVESKPDGTSESRVTSVEITDSPKS